MNRPLTLACLSLAAACLFATPALAQRSSRYAPQRPTLSPYFGFFQYNTTPLPNYQAFVRPREEMIADFRQDAARIGQLEHAIRLREAGDSGSLLRNSANDARSPSRAATFLNLQPFYPLNRALPTRR